MENRQIESTPIKFPIQAAINVRLNNLLLNKTDIFSFAAGEQHFVRFRMRPTDSSMQVNCPISLTLELGNKTAELCL